MSQLQNNDDEQKDGNNNEKQANNQIEERKYDRDEDLIVPQLQIGFIGAGFMTTEIISGMINRSVLAQNTKIIISDPYTQHLEKIYSKLTKLLKWYNNISIETTTNNKECIKVCDIVFIGVQPEHLPPIMTELYSLWNWKRN
eukprot:447667_1